MSIGSYSTVPLFLLSFRIFCFFPSYSSGGHRLISLLVRALFRLSHHTTLNPKALVSRGSQIRGRAVGLGCVSSIDSMIRRLGFRGMNGKKSLLIIDRRESWCFTGGRGRQGRTGDWQAALQCKLLHARILRDCWRASGRKREGQLCALGPEKAGTMISDCISHVSSRLCGCHQNPV